MNVAGYEVLDLVGSGGYSRVYRARQTAFDRVVALKVLSVGFESADQRRGFERECRAMGVLGEHPNIVTVFDTAETDDERACIVMEYYGGGTLGQRLAEVGPVPLEELLVIGVQIAGALETAHRRGVVHRDLKPHNLFLSDYGQPALGDFGISSFADERTISGAGGGLTVHYAAPEVIEGGGGTAASDVYSLGATIYTLLTGVRPFPRGEGQTVADLARRILFEASPRLDEEFGPASLADLLDDAMSKEVGQRPLTAEEFGRRLQDIQLELGQVPTSLPLSRGMEPVDARSTRTPVVAAHDRTGVAEITGPTLARASLVGGRPPADSLARSNPGGRAGELSPAEPEAGTPGRSRRLAGGVVGLCFVLVIVSAAWFMGSAGGGDAGAGLDADKGVDEGSGATSPDTADAFFSVPGRPGGVALRAIGDRAEVTWSGVEGAVAYQVHFVGVERTAVEVDESPALIDAAAVSCVEVVAVGASGHLSAPSSAACRMSENGTE